MRRAARTVLYCLDGAAILAMVNWAMACNQGSPALGILAAGIAVIVTKVSMLVWREQKHPSVRTLVDRFARNNPGGSLTLRMTVEDPESDAPFVETEVKSGVLKSWCCCTRPEAPCGHRMYRVGEDICQLKIDRGCDTACEPEEP